MKSRRQWPGRVTVGYIAVLSAAFLVAMIAGWSSLAEGMEGSAYDWMFRVNPPPKIEPSSVIVAFDERTLNRTGGMRNLRRTLADVLTRIRQERPAVVAIDVGLYDSANPSDPEDAALEKALAEMPNLVLASDILPGENRWEDPAPRFRKHASAVGHVHAAPDPVSRKLPLELVVGRDRRWAMALEAHRLYVGARAIEESPEGLSTGKAVIPARRESSRALYIRYGEGIPVVPAFSTQFSEVAGKTVFIGITAQSAARDRLMTPFGTMMTGVEIHAQTYETITRGKFLTPASLTAVALVCLFLTIAAGAIFATLSGWPAYGLAAFPIVAAHLTPHLAFANGIIFPYLAPVFAAWLSVFLAASWQYFIVRRQLRKSESDRARYQQAIHFVTHEMRSPLTAIQGSSELMGRYNLNDAKRKQMAEMINAESKRLARMIQTFLDIERLTDGQMEIRSEMFEASDVIGPCLDRARPLADRKQIELRLEEIEQSTLRGDRELMEYAVYNLLTNAVKYSPAETIVSVSAHRDNSSIRLSVRDQGIGMDDKELRSIFQKFYRTKKAEASGEVGTGIGLSIVDQIVTHHGGRMEVTSTPGKGSCFTMVLPTAPASKLVSY
ncbi:MAG TPA: CHASE2 domain-containing protein [Bryobacteraceae bacterium]|nr:CHASE2 domain-containing protein [Bryobacteraceae bacterium]